MLSGSRRQQLSTTEFIYYYFKFVSWPFAIFAYCEFFEALNKRYQVVSPDGAFARRRFARSQSRFARRKSRFARTKSRFARTKSRFARTNKILVDQVCSYCYWKQTSMNHAAYGHFDLSRVSCVQTLSIDTSVIPEVHNKIATNLCQNALALLMPVFILRVPLILSIFAF